MVGQPPTADVTSLGGLESPATAPTQHGPTQVEIAAKQNAEGVQAMDTRRYAIAVSRFREAAARVPEASYFFNLCMALYLEGRFGEALTACAAARINASAALSAKIEALVAQVRAEAERQHIVLDAEE